MHKLQKYLAYSALGLLAYMPFHVFISQWVSTGTGGLDAWKIGKDVFAAALTIICVAAVVWTRKHTKLYLYLLGGTIAYGLLHLVIMAATDQPSDTGLLATTYNVRLFCYAIIGYSVVLLAPKVVAPKKLAKLLIILSTIACLIALLQWVLPKDVMTHFGYSIERGVKPNFFIDDKPDLLRVFSTLRDPNSLGAFLILPFTLLSYGLVKFWKTNKRTLIGGLLMLHGLILFLTFSRGAWLGTAVALAVLLVCSKEFKRHFNKRLLRQYGVLLAASLVVLGGLVFVLRDQYVVQNVVFHSDENTQLTDSNNLHLLSIQAGLDGVAGQPFGHGPGTAGLVSIHQDEGALITENYFVQIAYEVGLFGLFLMLALMSLIVTELWPKRRDPLVLALIASFAGLTLMNMLFHTWANEAVAASWFLLAGALLGLAADGKRARSKIKTS